MAKNKILTVKIATDKAIAALEARLEKLNKDYAAQATKEQAFRKKYADWKKKLIGVARKALAAALKDDASIAAWLRDDSRGQPCVGATLDVKVAVKHGAVEAEPVRTWASIPDYRYNHMVEEIQQAIRILRMTDQPTVPASTIAALSRYL